MGIFCTGRLIGVGRVGTLSRLYRAHLHVICGGEHRHPALARLRNGSYKPTFEAETVLHNQVGTLEPGNVLRGRAPLMRVGPVGHDDLNRRGIAHGVLHHRAQNGRGHGDHRTATPRLRAGRPAARHGQHECGERCRQHRCAGTTQDSSHQ